MLNRTPMGTLFVQVPNKHILTHNLYYNYYYPNPKYLIIGYMDRLGYSNSVRPLQLRASLGLKKGA